MDTLLAGHRTQKEGPVSEAMIAQERDSGQVDIDYAVFDKNSTAVMERTGSPLEGIVARSFITIPAGLMAELVKRWNDRHPEGVKDDEQWNPLESPDTPDDSPAAEYTRSAEQF